MAVDYSGHRFGRLVVQSGRGTKRGQKYLCQCDCGQVVRVAYCNLKTGNTTSCGCYRMDLRRARKQPDKHIRISEVGRYYRRNALLRNIKWKLTREDIEELIFQRCRYCGFLDKTHGIGIDRLNNRKGYTITNVVPCCKICNSAKNDMTYHEFRDWVVRVYQKL